MAPQAAQQSWAELRMLGATTADVGGVRTNESRMVPREDKSLIRRRMTTCDALYGGHECVVHDGRGWSVSDVTGKHAEEAQIVEDSGAGTRTNRPRGVSKDLGQRGLRKVGGLQ
eukprot:3003682-Prymnesium_polylepis.2